VQLESEIPSGTGNVADVDGAPQSDAWFDADILIKAGLGD
jgi:hypothetical protein